MSGFPLSAIAQNPATRTLEQIQDEQDSVNAKAVYSELESSKWAAEGSALRICMSRSDIDPDLSQRLLRTLDNLKSQLARIPGGREELRKIERQYAHARLDTRYFYALAEKIHELVAENLAGHYEEQKQGNKRNDWLDVDNCEPPLPLIPRSINQFRTLTCLSLQNNKLTELAHELFDLDRLQQLHLANNCIKSIPEKIGRLHHLRVLDVEGNDLSFLPQALQDLTELEVLRAPNNQLVSFEINTSRLHRLTALYLYNNRIASVRLFQSFRLGCLHLENNRLTQFPNVEVLPSGCHVRVSGNPLQEDAIRTFKNEALQVYFVGYEKPELGKKRSRPEDGFNQQ